MRLAERRSSRLSSSKPTTDRTVRSSFGQDSDLDWDLAQAQTQEWLREDYSALYAEWEYRWIPPALLIERLLQQANGSLPLDYKFWVFFGKVEFIQVNFNRETNFEQAFFDADFNRFPVRLNHPFYTGEAHPPAHLREMMTIAERLADGEAFARIDLYDVDRPIFGEITLHPMAGVHRFEPREWDYALGRLMLPPKR